MAKSTSTRKTASKSAPGLSTTARAPIQINQNGIQLPSFDPNSILPSDLMTDSSSLPRTTKDQADAAVQSVEEKKNTVRIIKANIDLSSDLVSAATAYRKLEGLTIDYATEAIHKQAKAVRYDIAGVKLQTEQVKLQGEQHRLDQAQIRTDGLASLTEVTRDEWEQRKALARSKVDSLKLAVQQADTAYQESLRSLLSASAE